MTDDKRKLTESEKEAIWEVASKKWLADQGSNSLEDWLDLTTKAYLSLFPDASPNHKTSTLQGYEEAEQVRDRHISRWLNP